MPAAGALFLIGGRSKVNPCLWRGDEIEVAGFDVAFVAVALAGLRRHARRGCWRAVRVDFVLGYGLAFGGEGVVFMIRLVVG